MKKTLLLPYCVIASLLLITAFSCKKELRGGGISSLTTTNTDPNFVSLSMATATAMQINNSRFVKASMNRQTFKVKLPNGTTSVRTLSNTAAAAVAVTDRKIADVHAYPDDANPSFYIFNYAGGGFAIVSADKPYDNWALGGGADYYQYGVSLVYNIHP